MDFNHFLLVKSMISSLNHYFFLLECLLYRKYRKSLNENTVKKKQKSEIFIRKARKVLSLFLLIFYLKFPFLLIKLSFLYIYFI